MLKKEEVYLNIRTAEEVREVLAILKESKETIYKSSIITQGVANGHFSLINTYWRYNYRDDKTLITIDQLREILNVKKEFKVGDKVRILSVPDDFGEHNECIGEVGVVTEVCNSGVLIIDDNEWGVNFMPENLELVTEPTQTVIRKALAEIYPDVCIEWQKRIDTILLANKFRDEFEVSNSLVGLAYDEMVKDVQRDWLKKHLPKPKKMVTKEVVYYLNIISDDITLKYLTKQEALDDKYRCDEVIARAVKLTGTYQIEE